MELLSEAYIWGVLPRLVGALHVVAFISLWPQVIPLMGAQGVSPARDFLRRTRELYPGPQRFIDFPSLLWISSGDLAIRTTVLLGVAGGAWVVVGGPYSWLGLVVAWLAYLSLEPMGLSFPWDRLLLEVTFLTLFLPSVPLLPVVAVEQGPTPIAAFCLQWLVIRLMLGFAKVKFIGTKKSDRLYLKSFYVWMPMPNPVGWFLHHAPEFFHRASLAFMFFAEVICPILCLFPGWPRLVGATGLVALMIGIHVSGNWGFFNVGYVALSLCLLDLNVHALQVFSSSSWSSPTTIAASTLLCLHFAYTLIELLAFNSWITRAWTEWPIVERLTQRAPLLRLLIAVFRVVNRFGVSSSYGVFPPNAAPPVRVTPVFEGSDDGVTWKRYPCRFIPTSAKHRPPIVAPHHPRFDQALPYAGAGFGDGSFIASLVGSVVPLAAANPYPSMERVLFRMLRGDARVFASSPFDDAPRYARVSTVAFVPTTLEERRESGNYWREQRLGTLIAPKTLDDDFGDRWLLAAELFHPDLLRWRRKAAPLIKIRRAVSEGATLRDCLKADGGIDDDAIDHFFGEVLPVFVEASHELDGAIEQAVAFHKRFSLAERHDAERVLERLVQVAAHTIKGEPAPRGHITFQRHSRLRIWALQSEAELTRQLKDPGSLNARLTSGDVDHELFVWIMFRLEQFEFLARSFRWIGISTLIAGHARLPSILSYAEAIASITPREEEAQVKSVVGDDGNWSITFVQS